MIISRFKKKFRFIDDSYNASPLSVKNAILRFKLIKKEQFKKYLVLVTCWNWVKNQNFTKKFQELLTTLISTKYLLKEKTIFTYKHLNKDKRGNILQNIEDVDFSLSSLISNNDYLMIKGSNATGLNNLSKKIIKGY